jgi:two-component system sensor histidine kinase KdpD
MERLINNLLDMTRLESGGLMAKKEWQSVQEVVGAALHRLERRLYGRRVLLDVPDHLPLVQIDDVLIEQVLINLLDNAVEYTLPGTAIAITARRCGEVVEVEVADDGPGLPPGTEDRVFQKFFRASSATNRRGIGLGLAICRGIVTAHGGEIAACPRPGGGAAFRFTLPADAAPPPLDVVAAPVDAPATA